MSQSDDSKFSPGLKTVLIIDDEPSLAGTLALGLEANGYRSLCAFNATEGWKMAQSHMPDLVLCDIDMPGKDGRALLLEMRADPALSDLPIVLMTGKIELGNPRTVMDLGADDFLLKPFPLEDLFRCIAARLQRADLKKRINDRVADEMRLNLQSILPQKFFTPLARMLSLSYIMEEGLDTLAKQDLRQELRRIQDSGHELHRSLRNYLLLLELAPQGFVRPSALLDGETVGDALSAGINAAAKRRHRAADITRELTGASLRANPEDLGAVAEELTDNALSFSRQGSPVVARAVPRGDFLEFSVTDSGRGISAGQLEQIKAARQNGRKISEQQGLGLGLIIVHRLVRHLGGEFDLESESGRGSTARVRLPIRNS